MDLLTSIFTLLKKSTKLSLFSFLVIISLQAQPDKAATPEPMTEDQKLLDDLRKSFFGDRSLLEKYFQKDFLDKMDNMFKDSIQDFQGGMGTIKDFHQGLTGGFNGQWVEEKEGMVLVLEDLDPEKGAFDIKVVKGIVTLKGKIERDLGSYGKSMVNFSNSFPVPQGCDGDRMTVQKREKGVGILFPWKEGKAPLKINPKVINPNKIPVQKDKDDVTI